jgi:rod shape-determining protein MreC
VGKIIQVSSSSGQVLPINDPLSGVGAALKDSRLQGILKGAPNGTTTLQYIMSDEPVKPGEIVITSGGDRIFPKGLEIGTVATVEPGKDLFLNIRVIPSARLDKLEEVLVITKVEYKAPDTKDLGPIRASDILSQRLPGVPTTQAVDAAGNAIQQPANAVPGTSTTPAGAQPGVANQTANPANRSNKPPAAGVNTANPANATSAATNAPVTGTKPVRKPPADTTLPPATKPQADTTQPPETKPKPPEVQPQ